MRAILLTVVLLPLAMGVVAAEPRAVKSWDFEGDTGHWMTGDKQAQVLQCKDAAHVNGGAASLQFSFTPRPMGGADMPGTLFAPTEGGLPGGKALHFAMESSVGGPLLALLREADDSTYVYLFYVPADSWQVLDLPFADFHLEDSSKDENGRLDPDQIAGLGFIDPMGWFLQASQQNPNFPFFVAAPARRDLWVDDVQIMDEAVALKAAQAPGGAVAVMIEDCDSDPGYWAVLGGKNLKVKADADQAAAGSSLRLDYELPAKTVVAVARQVAIGSLAAVTSLVFSARSGADCKLAVSVEKSNKARYSTLVDLTAGTWRQLTVPLRDMKLDDDSKDPDGALRPEQVRSVQFADFSAALAGTDRANTLWLDEVMGVK
ncbi:MAG: hypothetical protein WCP21_06860 [Armatimonadota bacterium]